MITADGLTRSFADRVVVDEVSFEVQPGEVVGFLGPNGAGKTTTLRMLLGLLRPSSGEARLTRPVGHLPESYRGYDALSVEDQLRFWCRVQGLDEEAVPPALAATGLTELIRRPLGRLSKGQHQRVGLAQAVLGWPPSLILDEPTIGLDPSQLVDARNLVREAAERGAAVLLSTHLLAEAAAVCDRIVVIVGGCIVAEEVPGSSQELEDRFLRLVGEGTLT
jgi:ABC-2 type transport system ATP-binding protein